MEGFSRINPVRTRVWGPTELALASVQALYMKEGLGVVDACDSSHCNPSKPTKFPTSFAAKPEKALSKQA